MHHQFVRANYQRFFTRYTLRPQMGEAEAADLTTEWNAARAVLERLDNDLHDLRKQGFAFITGLFAVGAFFTSSKDVSSAGRLAVLLATLSLIVAVAVIDRNYRIMLQGAANRAKALERRSNFELTLEISRVYRGGWVGYFYSSVFVILIFAVGAFGALVLSGKEFALHRAATTIAVLAVGAIETLLVLRPWVYLEADNGVYVKGAKAFVTLTNLTKRKLTLGPEVWALYSEEEWGKLMKQHAAVAADRNNPSSAGLVLEPDQDYRWPLRTDLEPKLYRLVYTGPTVGIMSLRLYPVSEPKDQKKSAWPIRIMAAPTDSSRPLAVEITAPKPVDFRLLERAK